LILVWHFMQFILIQATFQGAIFDIMNLIVHSTEGQHQSIGTYG